MNKVQTLELIEDMRKSHELQMYKIDALLSGEEMQDLISTAKTECFFGKSLYLNEKHLKNVLGALFFEKLEHIHERWHVEYYKIYQIFEGYIKAKNEKKGFLSKIMGKKKIDEMELDKAKLYYSELKITTKELISILEMCVRRLSALNDSKFEEG